MRLKLKLKPTVLPFHLDGQVVLQFNGQYYRIPDPTGRVWEMTLAFDGVRDLDEIFARATEGANSDEATNLKKIASDYIEYKLLESVNHNILTCLSDHDQQCFSRNIDFWDRSQAQRITNSCTRRKFGSSAFAYWVVVAWGRTFFSTSSHSAFTI